MYRFIWHSIVCSVCAIVCPIALYANEPDRDSTDGYRPLVTMEEAVKKAIHVTGFTQSADSHYAVSSQTFGELITLHDSTMPFFRDHIDGRAAWRVEFSSVILDLACTTYEQEAFHPMNASVMIDAATSQVLEITLRSAEWEDGCLPEVSEREQATQLGPFSEKYHGLPTTSPSVTLSDALDQCEFYPLLAKEIVARYLMHTYAQRPDPSPVWVIQMRGVPSMSSHFPVTSGGLAIRRCVIDAMTGTSLVRFDLVFSPESIKEDTSDSPADSGGSTNTE